MKYFKPFLIPSFAVSIFFTGNSLQAQLNMKSSIPPPSELIEKLQKPYLAEKSLRDKGYKRIENSFYLKSRTEEILTNVPRTSMKLLEDKLMSQKNVCGRTTLKNSNGQLFVVDTVTVYLGTDTLRYAYSLDAEGRRLSELFERRTNGQWVNLFLHNMTYDANGDKLSELCEQWTDGQWVNF